jgi:hypothetical protein
MMRAVPPGHGVSTASAVPRKGGCSMVTSTPIRWSRALTTLLAGLLAVAAVVAAGYAATALLSQASDRSGAVCGSAWRYHLGSGTQVPPAELTPQQRARASQECAVSGNADWLRGVHYGRLAAAAAGAALVFALWSRFTRAAPRSPRRRPAGRPASGPGAPPARTADRPPW